MGTEQNGGSEASRHSSGSIPPTALHNPAIRWGNRGTGQVPKAEPISQQPNPTAWHHSVPHLSTTKAVALWLMDAGCSAHSPLGSSRVCTV